MGSSAAADAAFVPGVVPTVLSTQACVQRDNHTLRDILNAFDKAVGGRSDRLHERAVRAAATIMAEHMILWKYDDFTEFAILRFFGIAFGAFDRLLSPEADGRPNELTRRALQSTVGEFVRCCRDIVLWDR